MTKQAPKITIDDRLLMAVVDVAQAAGRRIMDFYQKDFSVQNKHDSSPVTEADMVAHDVIDDGLLKLTPEIPILSEEGDIASYEIRKSWQRYWLVDPLDGTREFVKHNDEFTVNIALIDGHKSVLGVIYAPVFDTLYFARQGGGAFKRGQSAETKKIQVKPWDGQHIVIAGSRSHRSEKFKGFLEHFNDYELLALGSSLKSCYVAEGRADVYARCGPTSEWDTASAQCILEEAGGKITDMAMQPLRYNTKESLLNPPFFAFGDDRHEWSRFAPQV